MTRRGAAYSPSTGAAVAQAQQRRLQRLRIGRSPIDHFGLFAVTALSAETRILPYQGEKISKAESHYRLVRGNAYIFALNERYDIDGQAHANTARFINHSCAPNCYALANTRTIWIVAQRDIAAGEELTYNYGFGLEDYQDYPCRCGAAACCGYMLDPKYWHLLPPV